MKLKYIYTVNPPPSADKVLIVPKLKKDKSAKGCPLLLML